MTLWRLANLTDSRRLGLRCGLTPHGRDFRCDCGGVLQAFPTGGYVCRGRCSRNWTNADFFSERWRCSSAQAAQMIVDLIRRDP